MRFIIADTTALLHMGRGDFVRFPPVVPVLDHGCILTVCSIQFPNTCR